MSLLTSVVHNFAIYSGSCLGLGILTALKFGDPDGNSVAMATCGWFVLSPFAVAAIPFLACGYVKHRLENPDWFEKK